MIQWSDILAPGALKIAAGVITGGSIALAGSAYLRPRVAAVDHVPVLMEQVEEMRGIVLCLPEKIKASTDSIRKDVGVLEGKVTTLETKVDRANKVHDSKFKDIIRGNQELQQRFELYDDLINFNIEEKKKLELDGFSLTALK